MIKTFLLFEKFLFNTCAINRAVLEKCQCEEDDDLFGVMSPFGDVFRLKGCPIWRDVSFGGIS